MAKVTGFLNDFQLGHLGDKHPTLTFRPSGAAVSGSGVFAPEDAVRVPVGVAGYFEADLQPTETMRPAVHYTVLLQWGSGQRSYLPGKLQVPTAGGVLADLIGAPSNPSNAWIGVEPPSTPTPGLWWLDPITGDLSEWSN